MTRVVADEIPVNNSGYSQQRLQVGNKQYSGGLLNLPNYWKYLLSGLGKSCGEPDIAKTIFSVTGL
jgi:hypothetical protein